MDEERALHPAQVFSFREADSRRMTERVEQTVVELYESVRPSLLGYVCQLVGSTSEAEDLVQVAFLKVFDQLRRGSQILNLRSWLYRVVHNLAIDHVRKQYKQESIAKNLVGNRPDTAGPRSTEDELIQRQQIEKSLEILNERERHCLMLRAEGLSYKEIAEVLTISPKAVSVYLARGLKKFEARDEKRG